MTFDIFLARKQQNNSRSTHNFMMMQPFPFPFTLPPVETIVSPQEFLVSSIATTSLVPRFLPGEPAFGYRLSVLDHDTIVGIAVSFLLLLCLLAISIRILRTCTGLGRMPTKKCYQRLRRRHQYVQRRSHHFLSPFIAPISAVLSLVLVSITFGMPMLNPDLLLEEAVAYCLSWMVLYCLAPHILIRGVIPVLAWLVALHMLLCVPSSVPQAPPCPCLPYERPSRRYGRKRRRASPYGTQSAGRVRNSAWGPVFEPTLPTIVESEEPDSLLPVPIVSVPIMGLFKRFPYSGKPPLYPKVVLSSPAVSPPRASCKRKVDGDVSIACERSAKRMRPTIVVQPTSPCPSPTVALPSPSTHDSVDDIGGDFYFSAHFQDNDSTDATVDNEDCASLTFSECESLADDELYGIDIDFEELVSLDPRDDETTSLVPDPMLSVPPNHPRDDEVVVSTLGYDAATIPPVFDDFLPLPEVDPIDDDVSTSDDAAPPIAVTDQTTASPSLAPSSSSVPAPTLPSSVPAPAPALPSSNPAPTLSRPSIPDDDVSASDDAASSTISVMDVASASSPTPRSPLATSTTAHPSTRARRRRVPPPPMEPSTYPHTSDGYGSMYISDSRYPQCAVVRRSCRTAGTYKPGMYKY